ncbi:hypothetical protein ME792_02420 [Lactobacillus delbrueckii]|nr:hypothetical protein ME792_02420 [Lactobacillus delbrueckii]
MSYAVKKLEEELGVPLFEREGRNIRLTVYGKVFKEYSEAGELDLAIVTTRPGEKIAGFDLVPMMHRKLELLLPAGHELAKQKSVSLKQIEQYPYLAFGEEHALAGIIADVFAKNDIHPQISSVTDDVRTLVDLVAIGEGVALLPKSKYNESAGSIAVPVTEDTSYTISLASRNLAQEPKVA